MSEVFNKSGIPSEFLIAESVNEVRDSVKRRLVTKEIKFVFVVDIYNEGIDIPEVNTVLFLRPTESLTVFLQQLGRGLRLSEGKEALTVLDFVGQAHKKYSFEERFKALLSRTRKTVELYWAINDQRLFQELMDLLDYQYLKIDFVDKPLDRFGTVYPLDLYCSYTFDQILVALGKHTEQKRSSFREGALYLAEKNLDVFFVTLNKSEKDYSTSTMYQDYSINEELFHWQSQSRTTEESITGQRYINQPNNGGNVLFFVREYKKEATFASPFTCIGFADFQSHYGSAPISIVWKMKESLPGFVMKKTVKV